MIILYHILVTVLLVLALPVLPLVWIFSEKRRANLLQRLGLRTGIPLKGKGCSRVWVHALSVGEVNSSLPFVTGLKQRMPDTEIVFTASTRTGYDTALRLMAPDREGSPVSVIGYFPFDVWVSVMLIYARIAPDSVCLVETDLWPGFLSIMKGKNVPVHLINARLSDRSLDGYLKLGRFANLFFSPLTHVMAQTQKDASGFQRLGIKASRISVTGNIKFDQPCIPMTDIEIKRMRERFGVLSGQPVWIAGSTHRGEEEMIAAAFSEARKHQPGLKLIIAPRDPARSRRLMGSLDGSGHLSASLSDGEARKREADIVFIDTMGELARAYGICDLAFVGGSLVERGGHNPLEPAMFGKPVLFGFHMTDFHEVADQLVDAGGAIRVRDQDRLAVQVQALLTDTPLRKQMGAACREVFLNNSGAVGRTLDIITGDSSD
ncbi:MAG: 3-deoxy-D-manno-octulosonic acid transferase [Desulfobacterales bacterium]|nr:3-deoxy-D-manno-octulosonic acid transferase [Desulfobacterales bacterium]